ncbi:hypothetical protein [Gordonia sputi]|uniref:hypothetical protein n=1 Tax=Gordonia sputi TaxID=36823 RepID=UPI0036854651
MPTDELPSGAVTPDGVPEFVVGDGVVVEGVVVEGAERWELSALARPVAIAAVATAAAAEIPTVIHCARLTGLTVFMGDSRGLTAPSSS